MFFFSLSLHNGLFFSGFFTFWFFPLTFRPLSSAWWTSAVRAQRDWLLRRLRALIARRTFPPRAQTRNRLPLLTVTAASCPQTSAQVSPSTPSHLAFYSPCGDFDAYSCSFRAPIPATYSIYLVSTSVCCFYCLPGNC